LELKSVSVRQIIVGSKPRGVEGRRFSRQTTGDLGCGNLVNLATPALTLVWLHSTRLRFWKSAC